MRQMTTATQRIKRQFHGKDLRPNYDNLISISKNWYKIRVVHEWFNYEHANWDFCMICT